VRQGLVVRSQSIQIRWGLVVYIQCNGFPVADFGEGIVKTKLKSNADMLWHICVTLDEFHADGYTDAVFLGWEELEDGSYQAIFQWTTKAGKVVQAI
jgi:hypothetical protein